MNSIKAHIIFNPVAGSGKAGKINKDLVNLVKSNFGLDFKLSITKNQGDATIIAAQIAKAGTPLIICVGGDGTINEVVNGLFMDGKPLNPNIEIGVVDCGTGRGFAQSIGLPKNLNEQLNIIFNGSCQAIDLAYCTYVTNEGFKTNRFFLSECQLGIGSAVVSSVGLKHKFWGGKIAFGYAALKEIMKSTTYPIQLSFNGTPTEENMIGIVIGNGHSCGGGMKLTPSAVLNDGLLDLLIIHQMSRSTQIKEFINIYSGAHINSNRFTYKRVEKLKVTSNKKVMVEMDGELLGYLPIEVKVIPRCLMVRCNL